MKSDKECIPCFTRQVQSTSGKINADEKLQQAALKKADEVISGLSMNESPARNTYYVLKEVYKVLECLSKRRSVCLCARHLKGGPYQVLYYVL